MSLTRREFLLRVGRAGGYSAAFVMMQSLGLLGVPETATAELRPVDGTGSSIVILGAGIAGLVAAYELRRAGWRVTVLEARERAGGRNWTLRGGSKVEFTTGLEQRCEFDEGNYFNAGPARLPSIHRNILHYCHELGVPLEVEVNSSRGALMQSDRLNGGQPVTERRVVNDTRGHVSELLAKSIDRGALDQEITADDRERMIEFLRFYGDLEPDLLFKGTERSGYKVFPGAGRAMPEPIDPLPMRALLSADLWQGMMSEEVIDWQPTMFQPVGGMDRIPAAFEKSLGGVVRYGAVVRTIRQTPGGVTVVYRDRKGADHRVTASYCICAMPLSIVRSLDADFSPAVRTAIDDTHYDSAYKIAWEAPRFWEKEDAIYGGLSYLRQTVGVVWYPSARLFSERGVIIGGYSVENGTAFGRLPSVEAKLDASRQAIDLLHPGHGRDLTRPIYISWGHIPYNLGSWISGFGHAGSDNLDVLLVPDRRVYFAGDHTSHLVGWQEGAVLSSYRVINQLGVRIANGGNLDA